MAIFLDFLFNFVRGVGNFMSEGVWEKDRNANQDSRMSFDLNPVDPLLWTNSNLHNYHVMFSK